MKIIRETKSLISLLLCAVLLCPLSAAFAAEPASDSIIDADKLNSLVEAYSAEYGIPSDRLSIGYYYSGTGDEWYYNGDMWYYPASMYKVPLMMLLAEKVSAGQLTQEDKIEGMAVGYLEELILTYSNNDYAHMMRNNLGGDTQWRTDAKKFAGLSEYDYPEDYLEYGFFSARYITQVMETLYSEPDRFPNLISCLLNAQPEHYFRLSSGINGVYDVAQKYGSYCDDFGQNFNHNTGVIYTPNPCIVTVMTVNVPNYEKVISDIAVMLTDYTLTLDGHIDTYRHEQQEKAEAQAEAERIAQEEKKRRQQELERAEQQEKQRQQQERLDQLVNEQLQKQREKRLTVAALIAAGFIVVLTVALICVKRRLRFREYKRRFEYELALEEALEEEYQDQTE